MKDKALTAIRLSWPAESVDEMWDRIGAPSVTEPDYGSLELQLIAMPVAAPELGKIMYRADFREMEFNFRGEQRTFILSAHVEPCPHCRGTPMMKTEPMAVYSFEAKMGYAIFCPTCGNQTPLFKSSESAMRNWRLTAKLQQ